jgi:hypothetical protein
MPLDCIEKPHELMDSTKLNRKSGYLLVPRQAGTGGMTKGRVAAHLGTGGEGWTESKRLHRPLVGVGAHSVIKLFEEDAIFFSALLLGQADGPGPLDHDLGGVGLGFEDLHGLVEVVGEGHGARV